MNVDALQAAILEKGLATPLTRNRLIAEVIGRKIERTNPTDDISAPPFIDPETETVCFTGATGMQAYPIELPMLFLVIAHGNPGEYYAVPKNIEQLLDDYFATYRYNYATHAEQLARYRQVSAPAVTQLEQEYIANLHKAVEGGSYSNKQQFYDGLLSWFYTDLLQGLGVNFAYILDNVQELVATLK
jgi:hypothetical protein